jgi:hypothetical protein
MSVQSLSEAEKMRRVPGIVFADGPGGRRARVASADLDVWEIIRTYMRCGEDRTAFYEAFESLTEDALSAAFHYYRAFPEEIDSLLYWESSRQSP